MAAVHYTLFAFFFSAPLSHVNEEWGTGWRILGSQAGETL